MTSLDTSPKNLPIPKLVPLPHASYQTEKEKLSAWITKFVYSFREGNFRSILETARFLRRPGGVWQTNSLKVISGLAVVITCDTWKDYKQLVTKTKQLSYRIRKLDAQVDLLLLLSPGETITEVTSLATLESFAIRNSQGRSFLNGGKG